MLGSLLIAGGILLGVMSGADASQIAGYFVEGALGWQTVQLVAVVTMVEMVAVLMEHTGGMARALQALRRLISDVRVLIALVPTLLGPLPVPGGAMLSAPMVGKYGDEMGLAPDDKASINLLFRHVWDLLSPFKPTVILAAAVLNIPMFTLIGWQLPISAMTFIFAYWYMIARRPVPAMKLADAPVAIEARGSVWTDIAPLLLPVALALTVGIDFVYAMSVGLLFGLVSQRVSRPVMAKMIREGIDPRMIFTLASVMVFKTSIEHTDVMRGVTEALAGYGVPLLILVIILPMAIGHAVGMELPAVALVLPLVLGLLPPGTPILPYAIVMLTANAVGSILSPVHVCVVVGNNFFGASWARVVWQTLPAMAVRMASAILLAWMIATYLSA